VVADDEHGRPTLGIPDAERRRLARPDESVRLPRRPRCRTHGRSVPGRPPAVPGHTWNGRRSHRRCAPQRVSSEDGRGCLASHAGCLRAWNPDAGDAVSRACTPRPEALPASPHFSPVHGCGRGARDNPACARSGCSTYCRVRLRARTVARLVFSRASRPRFAPRSEMRARRAGAAAGCLGGPGAGSAIPAPGPQRGSPARTARRCFPGLRASRATPRVRRSCVCPWHCPPA